MAIYYPTVVSSTYTHSAGNPLPQPSRPLTEGIKSSTISFSADSGHEQRRQKGDPKRTFTLQYTALTLDEFRTFRDFYLLVTNVSCFYWTHPVEKTTFQVRFDSDTFSGENFAHGPKGPLYKFQINIVQDF